MTTTAALINQAFPELPAPLSGNDTGDLTTMRLLREYLSLDAMITDAQARRDELRSEILNRLHYDATLSPGPPTHANATPLLDHLSGCLRPDPRNDHHELSAIGSQPEEQQADR